MADPFFNDIFGEGSTQGFDLSSIGFGPMVDDHLGDIEIKEEEDVYSGDNFTVYGTEYVGSHNLNEDAPPRPNDHAFMIPPPPVNSHIQSHPQQTHHHYDGHMGLSPHDRRRISRSTSPTDSSTSESSLSHPSEDEMSSQVIPPPPPPRRMSSQPRRSNQSKEESKRSRKRRKRKKHEIEEDTKRLQYLRSKKNKSESEKAELRKLRNRDSAMRSRAKKAKEMKTKEKVISEQGLTIRSLELEVDTLRTEVGNLQNENQFLRKENDRLRSQLPSKMFSCAAVLVIFVVLAFVVCKLEFTPFFPSSRTDYSLVEQPEDDYYDYYRDPVGRWEYDDITYDAIKALPESTSTSSSSSKSLTTSMTSTRTEERNEEQFCYYPANNGMIPVDQKVKQTVRDPVIDFDLLSMLKERKLTFSEEMHHHFVSNPQFVYVNSDEFDSREEFTSVPPAMTTSPYHHHGSSYPHYQQRDCETSGGSNGSKNCTDTIFIEDEDDEFSYNRYQQHNKEDLSSQQTTGGEEDPSSSIPSLKEKRVKYKYARKNESGEIEGYYYSTEDWGNIKMFMTPHMFHMDENEELKAYDHSKFGEDDDEGELIFVFPVEQIKSRDGKSMGLFKLAEIHIPSKDVHFGESFWSFQPLDEVFGSSK